MPPIHGCGWTLHKLRSAESRREVAATEWFLSQDRRSSILDAGKIQISAGSKSRFSMFFLVKSWISNFLGFNHPLCLVLSHYILKKAKLLLPRPRHARLWVHKDQRTSNFWQGVLYAFLILFDTGAVFFFKLIYMHVQLLSITHITIGYHSDCTRKLITFDQLPFQVLQEWAWSAWPSWMHLLEAQRAFLTLSTAPKGLKNGEQC